MSRAREIARERWACDPSGYIECWYCGIDLDGQTWHAEHQVPRARGGTDHPSNLVLSCVDCNRKKGARTVEEYRVVEWERRLEVCAEFFGIIERIESFPDNLFVFHCANGRTYGLSQMVSEVASWLGANGAQTVRFNGDEDGERFFGEPVEHATLSMMRAMAGLHFWKRP